MKSSSNHLRSALISIAAMLMLAACATPHLPPPQSKPVIAAQICTADATTVSCGRKAPYCQSSGNGHAVACGAAAPHCEASTDAKAVACGGKAKFCMQTPGGDALACGGEAQYCERSQNGKEVACYLLHAVEGWEGCCMWRHRLVLHDDGRRHAQGVWGNEGRQVALRSIRLAAVSADADTAPPLSLRKRGPILLQLSEITRL